MTGTTEALQGALTRLGIGVEWSRPVPSARALRTDVWAGLAVAALAVPGYEVARSSGMLASSDRAAVEQLLWTVAMVLPLCVRRRYPVLQMALSSAVFLAMGIRDPITAVQVVVQVALFASLYNGVAWGRDRRATAVVLAGIVLVMTGWLVVIFTQASAAADFGLDGDRTGLLPQFAAVVLSNAGINVLYFFGAALFGQVSWMRAMQTERLAEQAERLGRQQAEIARRAVVDERLRIARELHDVAAHHVSVIGVQAAAARRVLDVDADATRAALSSVEQSSRQAVGEMRQLLGVLRHDDGSGTGDGEGRLPQPGLETLEALVAEVTDRGLSVTLTRVGEPRPISSTMALSLYRTVQEALANVARHSTARTAAVALRWSPEPATADWVEVEVLDGGRPRDGAGPGTNLGHVGMRERAELHHGEVEIGPRPVGGYRVRLRLPLVGSAQDDVQAPTQAPTADPTRVVAR